MKATFKGIELRTGMRVVLENGTAGVIILSDDIINLQDSKDASRFGIMILFLSDGDIGWMPLDPRYTEEPNSYQIVKLFAAPPNYRHLFMKAAPHKDVKPSLHCLWERKPTPKISIADHTVVFRDGGIEVGCTFVEKKTIKEIAKYFEKEK